MPVRVYFFILLLSLFSACYTYYPLKDSKKYENKWPLPDSEKEVESAIHWVKSKRDDGKYVYRQYYPETGTLIKYWESDFRSFSSLDGKHASYTDSGLLLEEGFHKDGYKHGEWKFYWANTDMLMEEISYNNGSVRQYKSYYESTGKLMKYIGSETNSYNSQSNDVIYKTTVYDSTGTYPISESIHLNGEVKTNLSRDNDYYHQAGEKIGGVYTDPSFISLPEFWCKTNFYKTKDGIDRYISNKLKTPKSAKKNFIHGNVAVYVVVDEEGNISDMECISCISDSLKNASFTLIEKMPQWCPGTKNGKAVKTRLKLILRYPQYVN